jgi:hypothetical protein
MHDHHAIRCSGRLISPPTVMKYGTIKWIERYMSEVVASAKVVSVDGGGGGSFVSSCGWCGWCTTDTTCITCLEPQYVVCTDDVESSGRFLSEVLVDGKFLGTIRNQTRSNRPFPLLKSAAAPCLLWATATRILVISARARF